MFTQLHISHRLLAPRAARQKRPSSCVQAWLRPASFRPAYYEVLRREDVEQKTIDEWKRLTKLDEEPGTQARVTWISALTFFHGFIVYYVIPLSFRYSWYRFWRFVRMQLLYPLQKKWALMDARTDAYLSNLAGNGYRFSRVMVSMRLHGRIGPGRELRYRIGLLRGKDVDHCLEFTTPQTLHTETANAAETSS